MPVNGARPTTALAIAIIGGSQTVSGYFGRFLVETTATQPPPALNQILDRDTEAAPSATEAPLTVTGQLTPPVTQFLQQLRSLRDGDQGAQQKAWEQLEEVLTEDGLL